MFSRKICPAGEAGGRGATGGRGAAALGAVAEAGEVEGGRKGEEEGGGRSRRPLRVSHASAQPPRRGCGVRELPGRRLLRPPRAPRLTVRLLEPGAGAAPAELLGLAAAGVGDQERPVVL